MHLGLGTAALKGEVLGSKSAGILPIVFCHKRPQMSISESPFLGAKPLSQPHVSHGMESVTW